MGQRLFFLSLIILSIAMGLQWLKNRPKAPPKPPRRAAVAVNLDDLEVASQPQETAPATETVAAPSTTNPDSSEGSEETSKPTKVVASATPDAGPSPREEGDPVILAFTRLDRTPFEPSPFIAMMEAAGKPQKDKEGEREGGPTKKPIKPTTLMKGEFLGTIETPKALVAIVDSRLYKAGETFNDIPIVKIDKEVILLENDDGKFLIPKKGVVVHIASDGTYTISDTFRKSR